MTSAVVFGLASALLYGTADILARLSGRAAGVFRTMLYGQSTLALAVGAWIFVNDQTVVGTVRGWALLIASNLAILLATLLLYRGLTHGRVGVVAPVAACYGAVAAVLSVIAGEHIASFAAFGLGLAILGAVLASVPGSDRGGEAGQSGFTYGAGAAILYGVGFWVQGRYSVPEFGSVIPVWTYYVTGAVGLLAVGVVTRGLPSPPAIASVPLVLGTAALASGGYFALLMGQATGAVAVTTALSSLASAVTVVVARVALAEPISQTGWVGIACVGTGLPLLHLGE